MDKKISQLIGATTPLTGTEELAIVQGGSTVKATAQDVADLGGAPYKSYIGLISYASGVLNFANEIYNDTGITITWVPDTYGEGGIQASLLTVPDDSKVVCFVQKQRPQFSTATADYWTWPLIDNTFTYTDVLVVNSVAPNNIVAYIEIRIYP